MIRSTCLAVILAALTFLLATASAAEAAETVVNFDTLPAGELVTNQYHAQGLEFGLSSAFGQTSPGVGDCGAPSVQGDAVNEPPSPPNYAVLARCRRTAAEANFSGTYGELLDHPAGAISVYVRDLEPGFTVIQVKLTAYDTEGKPIDSVTGEAGRGKWTHITLPDSGEAQIGYFSLATTTAGEDTIAIDDLGFLGPQEAPPGKPGEGGETKTGTPGTPETKTLPGTTSGGSSPQPPIAVGTVVSANPHAGEPVTLSGAGSSPGSGQIISYEWDFNNDGKIDTSTGKNPLAHVMLPTGGHTIGLTVTNSKGEKSSSRFGLVLSGVSAPPPADGGEGPCLTNLEVVNAEISAECIQKKGSGGEYAIETKQLGLNGMVLAPPGGGYGVYKLQSIRHFGLGTEYRLSGTPVVIELANTPIGDLVLGGYDLETEPIDLGIEPEHRTSLKITASLRAHAADEERIHNLKGSPIMLFGVGHQCNNGSKALGCCPPPGPTKACGTLPGDFPLTGDVAVYLAPKGQALFDVQVGLDLKAVNFQATGELELLSSRETGIALSTLRFTIPEASLAPIFKVKEASFVYYFPGNPDPEKRDTWQAKATVTFGLATGAGLEGELSFQKGEFHTAALKLLLPPPGIPVYSGVYLNRIGASVGVNPLEFGGSLGAKIASALELELAFKYSEATGQQLGFFGGKGSLSYEENVIAALEGDVYSDGYSDALLQLKISVPFGSKEPVVSVEGEIGYWDEAKTGLWEAYGRVHAKLWVIEGELAGLVNNHYIAGCGFLGPFGALGYWNFETSKVGGEGFFGGNCHDDLKPYKQVPLAKHSGGFVNETETELLHAPLVSSAATSPRATIALASDPLGRDLRISSSSGTPIVTLSGPGGQSYTTPATSGKVNMAGTSFVSALGSDPHELIVYLSSPAGGEWHLKRAPGSAPISSVEVAEVAPPPSIRTSVHRHGKSLKLSYTAKNLIPGTKVRFYERGKDSIHGLATVSAAKGSVAFTPTQALGRTRKVYATVIAQTGVPLQTLTVATYTAPSPFRPGRARRARLQRHGDTALLSWGSVAGAKVFMVKVKGSDGRVDTFFAKPSARSEKLLRALPAESFTATITAVGGPDMLPGPSAKTSLRAVKVRHASPKRRSGKRRR